MRSKCIRYSSSSACRSSCCARSTRRRTSAFESLTGRGTSRVASSAITETMPRSEREVTRKRSRGLRSRAETDPALAGEPLYVDHPLQRDRVPAVLGLQRQRGLAGPCAQLRRAERLLERIGTGRQDEGAHDLPAVERNLDPDPFSFNHLRPPPKERRG